MRYNLYPYWMYIHHRENITKMKYIAMTQMKK